MVKRASHSVFTTGLAGAAALAGVTQAYGAVVVRPIPANIAGKDPTTTTSSTTTQRNIDVDGNGTTDIRVGYRSFTVSGYVIQQSFVQSLTGKTLAYGPVGSNSQYYAYRLAAGDIIPGSFPLGQNATFLTHVATNIDGSDYGLTGPNAWYLGNRGFVGFNFTNASGQLVNGYVEMQTNAWAGAGTIGVQFFSLGYESTPGQSIAAGAVPEPSTLAALAFGGAGLAAMAYRRRKAS